MIDLHNPDWLNLAMRETGADTETLASISGVSCSQVNRIRAGMAPRLPTALKLKLALEGMNT